MALTELDSGPGYTIVLDDEAQTSVPYVAEDHENGDRNHGFFDLADRPDLAETITEARRSAGMMRALKVINAVGSRFRTIGCECGLFKRDPPAFGKDRYIGSYISVTFRDTDLNTAHRIEALARAMLARVTIENTEHVIFYEITVMPLRKLFGQTGRFEMHVNAIGLGASDEEAWAAFGTACNGIAHAFEQINELAEDDPLFAA